MSYQSKDSYFRRAKKEGYRSRAAYKLLELNRRFRLIQADNRVLDLGSTPGGWLQVASKLVEPKGKVIGVDLQPILPLNEKDVIILQGDIQVEETQIKIRELLGGPANCVLSDLSPRLSGIHDADVSRSMDLARTAFEVASRLLKPGGNFLVKTFIGEESAAFFDELKPHFASLQRTRSEATRKGSSEIYYLGKGFRRPVNSHSAIVAVARLKGKRLTFDG